MYTRLGSFVYLHIPWYLPYSSLFQLSQMRTCLESISRLPLPILEWIKIHFWVQNVYHQGAQNHSQPSSIILKHCQPWSAVIFACVSSTPNAGAGPQARFTVVDMGSGKIALHNAKYNRSWMRRVQGSVVELWMWLWGVGVKDGQEWWQKITRRTSKRNSSLWCCWKDGASFSRDAPLLVGLSHHSLGVPPGPWLQACGIAELLILLIYFSFIVKLTIYLQGRDEPSGLEYLRGVNDLMINKY